MTKYSLNMLTNNNDVPIALFSNDITIDIIEEIGQMILDYDRSYIGYSIYDFETGKEISYVS